MTTRQTTNFYANTSLDRASHLRKDEDWLTARLADPDSRIVPVWRSRNLIEGVDEDVGPWAWAQRDARGRPLAKPAKKKSGGARDGGPGDSVADPPRPAFLDPVADRELLARGGEPVLLGIMGEAAHFAVDFSDLEEPACDPGLAGRGLFVDLRQVGAMLGRGEGSLLAYARGILTWHRNHLFCGRCGAPTVSEEAGHLRKCGGADCRAAHFPRTDPAVIMLVTHGDKCLLGRQKVWPEGMHSTLAGFVEPGESLEDAVAREVFEESGVRVSQVRYHSSQPWPFPTSLMLGFHATAEAETLDVNTDELESAAWFSRDWILEHDGGKTFRMPRGDSIARQLIEAWMHGEV